MRGSFSGPGVPADELPTTFDTTSANPVGGGGNATDHAFRHPFTDTNIHQGFQHADFRVAARQRVDGQRADGQRNFLPSTILSAHQSHH